MQAMVRLVIPFDALVESVKELELEEKQELALLLEEQIAQAEEGVWEQSATFQQELRAAREAYAAGDYVTVDDYIDQSNSPR